MAEIEIYTTAKKTHEWDVQDALKKFYNISRHEVDITRVSMGHFKIKGSQSVIKQISDGKGPKKWTTIESDSISGYSDKDHVTITITYSDENVLTDSLKATQPTAVNFVQLLTSSKKLSYNCVITVHKIDQCMFYTFSDAPIETATPLVKIDVSGHNGADVSADDCIQGDIRGLLESQFKNCWIVWTYNGSTVENWKQIS